jgi:hypothetical protein
VKIIFKKKNSNTIRFNQGIEQTGASVCNRIYAQFTKDAGKQLSLIRSYYTWPNPNTGRQAASFDTKIRNFRPS